MASEKQPCACVLHVSPVPPDTSFDVYLWPPKTPAVCAGHAASTSLRSSSPHTPHHASTLGSSLFVQAKIGTRIQTLALVRHSGPSDLYNSSVNRLPPPMLLRPIGDSAVVVVVVGSVGSVVFLFADPPTSTSRGVSIFAVDAFAGEARLCSSNVSRASSKSSSSPSVCVCVRAGVSADVVDGSWIFSRRGSVSARS